MASMMACRRHLNLYMTAIPRNPTRMLTTTSETITSPTPNPSTSPPPPEIDGYYKITLRRSAISLGEKIKGTLVSLGIHRRNQTVYHKHSPIVAGKILKLKELVEVENVPEDLVRTNRQQREDRKAPRGYKLVGSKRDTFMHI